MRLFSHTRLTSKSILDLCIASFCFFLLKSIFNHYSPKPTLVVSAQERKINIKKHIYPLISLGNKRMLSDFLWIDTLISSDLKHYKRKDLKNWIFLRFDTITELDPFFYQAYQYAGPFLSVVSDDDAGALFIYEKGLKFFPHDLYLSFFAGIHAYFELQNDQLALRFLRPLLKNPKAPRYLPSLIAKLQATTGEPQDAYDLLYPLYKTKGLSKTIKQHYAKTLYALKAEIDLICLNGKRARTQNCELKDFYGNYYLLGKDGLYYATNDWKPARPAGSRK